MKNEDGIHGQHLVNHLLDGVGRDRIAFPVDGPLCHNDDVQPLACLPANFKTPKKFKISKIKPKNETCLSCASLAQSSSLQLVSGGDSGMKTNSASETIPAIRAR